MGFFSSCGLLCLLCWSFTQPEINLDAILRGQWALPDLCETMVNVTVITLLAQARQQAACYSP